MCIRDRNKAHAERLSYTDDMNRNNGEEGSKRARIDSSNWQVLSDFRFTPAPAADRLVRATQKLAALVLWFFAVIAIGLFASRRLTP